MRYKIIIDSCGELLDEWKKDECFESIPLTLMVGAEQIIDDETFDQAEFINKVAACPECPKSACPSPERYMRAYDCEAEHIYVVTLSSELSGSYNSALLGRDLIMEDHPDKKIHVFNSRSASIGESLIGMKIQECEEAGMSFEEVVSTVEHYIEGQHTFFILENLDTLRKNGRLSKVKALVASALKIKPVMGSTDDGNICQLDQARGMKKALVKMVLRLLARDAKGTLKASRVVQLRKIAEETGSERFMEGVQIIEEAYQPAISKQFIRAEVKNENGAWVCIPLGMTEA